ncbi:MAG TPA: BlaI/MecI/CopY family transcriptional regulator [Thermoanaerobaculia bacterium]|nr:BlaI/MecI/CopY family transcriptional regulator [Thermoanaerobaculia bacterium]
MPKNDPLNLSRRERQILEVIFKSGRATANDVLAALPDAPTYTTIRGLLRVLESKGHVRHEEEDGRYVYFPTMSRTRAAKSVLRNVVNTFFDNSPSAAMAALLGSERSISEDELDRLEDLVAKARKKQ